jgi:periplasmic divalent cation tolerance protein
MATNQTRNFALVLMTAPNLKTAKRLAQAALRARLAACANIVPNLKSLYWWKGKIMAGNEVLVLFKTTATRLGALEKLILAEHPYDTPEFVVLSINKGNRRYLDWLEQAVG